MSSIIIDEGVIKFEGGSIIHATNPASCICCGADSISEPSVSSESESESDSVFDGECCVYVTGLAHCIQNGPTDTVGEWLCTSCHPGPTPSSSSGDPTTDGRNVWFSSGYGYDMTSGDWYVEQKACVIYYDMFTGTTYWPPFPVAPTISTTTAANAVLTSYTASHDCSTTTSSGCYNATGCSYITVRFEGTSNVPTCANCPSCSGYSSGNLWSFSGYETPYTGSSPGEEPCGGDPYRPEPFSFRIRTDCNPSPSSYKLVGEACDSCT